MNQRFHDDSNGGWYATSGNDPSVLLRLKEDYDGAEPSGNSLAALACLRLGELCERPDWTAKAEGCVKAFAAHLGEEPHAGPLLLVALDWLIGGPTHIVVAGAGIDAQAAHALIEEISSHFVARRVLARAEDVPWAREMSALSERPTTYVCRDRACERPTNDRKQLAEALSRLAPTT
jgi:uncharacterized protein YyaL (SSP411 family)